VGRALAASQAKYQAGSLDDALALLATAEAGALDDQQRARALVLRARIAFASRHSSDGLPLLLQAARDAEAVDVDLARQTYLEAFHAAMHAGRLDPAGLVAVSEAALACPAAAERRPRDILLDGLATRAARGYTAGAPILAEALDAFLDAKSLPPEDADWLFLTFRAASDLWDDEKHMLLSARELVRARSDGALAALPRVLATRITAHAVHGELDEAAALNDEMRTVAGAVGIAAHSDGEILVAALRGREDEAPRLIEHAAAQAHAQGEGLELSSSEYASAILYNGFGRYEEAYAAVRHAVEYPHEIGMPTRIAAELVEAAARTGNRETAARALVRLAEMARASGGPWVVGVEARSRALLSRGAAAEDLYREAVDRLSPTRLRPELARTHLVYGEWLRREGRRVDARQQLRLAHELLTSIGMEAFAERARRELIATGEKVRRRVDETRGDLTPQEEQIARLAREGLTNPEIGAQLFLSPRTVEWHLRKVFTKLGISSRSGLRTALPRPEREQALA
jgi:DNA-binding CsgD family transcriptional regulator